MEIGRMNKIKLIGDKSGRVENSEVIGVVGK